MIYDAKCPECGGKMTSEGTGQTLVAFLSPPGHNHDDNCRDRMYSCENGHSFKISKRNRCPVEGCDWIGQDSCFCHKEMKVDEWPEPYSG